MKSFITSLTLGLILCASRIFGFAGIEIPLSDVQAYAELCASIQNPEHEYQENPFSFFDTYTPMVPDTFQDEAKGEIPASSYTVASAQHPVPTSPLHNYMGSIVYAHELYAQEHQEKDASNTLDVSNQEKQASTNNKFACDILNCNFTAKRASHLKKHIRSHDKKSKEPYICLHPHCTFTAYRAHKLSNHKLTHENNAVPCNIPGCLFKSSKMSHLTNHIEKCHPKRQNNRLNQQFSDQLDTIHLDKITSSHQTHTSETQVNEQASNRSFDSIRSDRNKDNEFRANNDQITGRMLDSLSMSTYAKCSHFRCNKVLINQQRHMRTHTSDKAIACEHCTFRSTQKKALEEHQALYHLSTNTSENPSKRQRNNHS